MSLPRSDLPAHHPQNTPLEQWNNGWLVLSVAGHVDPLYIVSSTQERRARGWPVTRDDMISFLIEKGDIPAAGTGRES